MNFKELFGQGAKEPSLDPLQDLVLHKLQPGFMVDYDLKTYTVQARHHYDFDGLRVSEWELSGGEGVHFLQMYDNGEEVWMWSKKIPAGLLGDEVRDKLFAQQEPPTEVSVGGVRYLLYADAAGYFYKNGLAEPQPMLTWDYCDESEEDFLSIEQWGERDVVARRSLRVEPYQFSNILPGPAADA